MSCKILLRKMNKLYHLIKITKFKEWLYLQDYQCLMALKIVALVVVYLTSRGENLYKLHKNAKYSSSTIKLTYMNLCRN